MQTSPRTRSQHKTRLYFLTSPSQSVSYPASSYLRSKKVTLKKKRLILDCVQIPIKSRRITKRIKEEILEPVLTWAQIDEKLRIKQEELDNLDPNDTEYPGFPLANRRSCSACAADEDRTDHTCFTLVHFE